MNIWESAVLLVDDEPALSQMVKNLLIKEGFGNVDIAACCTEALSKFRSRDYQIILLDVMLPDGDGFSLFERMEKEGKQMDFNRGIPVIFLSARDEDHARLKGLGLGADDYITKPFLPEELILRVKAVLRRSYRLKEEEPEVRIGAAVVNWEAGTVRKGGEDYMLTAKEYILLKKLWENKGKILSINTLCDTLWPDGSYGYENSLMVHIRRLREKIEEIPSRPECLITVRGLGYKLRPENGIPVK